MSARVSQVQMCVYLWCGCVSICVCLCSSVVRMRKKHVENSCCLKKKEKEKLCFLKKYFGLVGLKNVMFVVLFQQCPFERAENPQACHHDLMFAFTFILSQNKIGFTVLKCCRTSCKKVLFWKWKWGVERLEDVEVMGHFFFFHCCFFFFNISWQSCRDITCKPCFELFWQNHY